jgi:hypothetical protein
MGKEFQTIQSKKNTIGHHKLSLRESVNFSVSSQRDEVMKIVTL